MSNINFEEYKLFSSREYAKEYTDILDKCKIEYILEKTTPFFDISFVRNAGNQNMVLKLQPKDFERADQAYADTNSIDLNALDKEYYLFSFTDEELFAIIEKKDEWNEFDYILAQKLLKDRGKEISLENLNLIRKKRMASLSQHKPTPQALIIAAYFFAFLGGIIGIVLGLQLLWDSKKLPDGQKMYSYELSVRNHGKIIVLIGIIILGLTIISFLLKAYEGSELSSY